MRPVGIILDFDGVIVDSLKAHLAAWCDAVEAVFQQKLESPEELSGHSSRTIASILCRRFGDAALTPVLIAAKEDCLTRRQQDIHLLPGVRDFIAAAAAGSLPLGVASNSNRAFVSFALAAFSLEIPVVVTGDDVSRGKPAPDLFWECSNRLAIPPNQRREILVFEDSPHGLKAARDAGMVPIGVTTELPASKLLAAGALGICGSLGEALAKGWRQAAPPMAP